MKKIVIACGLLMSVWVGGSINTIQHAKKETAIVQQELVKTTNAYAEKDEELSKALAELTKTSGELEKTKQDNVELSTKLDQVKKVADKLTIELEEAKRKK